MKLYGFKMISKHLFAFVVTNDFNLYSMNVDFVTLRFALSVKCSINKINYYYYIVFIVADLLNICIKIVCFKEHKRNII